MTCYYIIPSDNWEQQRAQKQCNRTADYIIPSDNWEQQQVFFTTKEECIISYQAITGNNNCKSDITIIGIIISYQAITGNNNFLGSFPTESPIISYQAITGNNNLQVTDAVLL